MHETLLLPISGYHPIPMRPLLYLSNAFVNTFGITQPDQKSAVRAAWFIAGLLILMVAVVTAVGGIALHIIFQR
jgi:hypothetical protein